MSDDRYAQLLADLQAAKSEGERFWITMRFNLDELSPAVQEMVWAAAVPHWFDREFLTALVDQNEISDTDFESLLALSYIEEFPQRGWNMHERTRAMLRDHLWEQERGRYRQLSQRAAAYCAEQDQNNVIWRVENLYHQLIAQQPRAEDKFSAQGIEWHNQFEYEKIEILIRPILNAVKKGYIEGNAAAWAYYRQARLDINFSNNDEAKSNLEEALCREVSDQTLIANCIKSLGDVHRMMSEYEEAREKYEEARPIYAAIGDRLGEANCIQSLGDVHRMMSEYEEAREKYEEARPIYAAIGARLGEANCIKSLGDVHYMIDEYEEAREKYEEARPIYAAIGARLGEANCIKSLGDVH